MTENKIKTINTYIQNNISPILIDGITASDISNSVVIPSDCKLSELNGHYEGIEFMPPKWYDEIMAKKDSQVNILVIDNLNNISPNEQLKFYEILKYRKISTFELPDNCTILITCEEVNKDKISKEIYSLVAHL